MRAMNVGNMAEPWSSGFGSYGVSLDRKLRFYRRSASLKTSHPLLNLSLSTGLVNFKTRETIDLIDVEDGDSGSAPCGNRTFT